MRLELAEQTILGLWVTTHRETANAPGFVERELRGPAAAHALRRTPLDGTVPRGTAPEPQHASRGGTIRPGSLPEAPKPVGMAAMPSFLRGHIEVFDFFGRMPRVLLYDNLKSAVLERAGDAIRFHPTLFDLAAHTATSRGPWHRVRGNEKGCVERAIRYLRDSFFAARPWSSVDDLTRRPWHGRPDWLLNAGGARRTGGRRGADAHAYGRHQGHRRRAFVHANHFLDPVLAQAAGEPQANSLPRLARGRALACA